MAAQKLSSCKNLSEVLAGSVVCYTPEMKRNLLNISKNKMEKYTCESMEITEELVKQLSKKVNADVYAAVTGLASPGASETKQKPVGTTFICIYYRKKLFRKKVILKGNPDMIRRKACLSMYELILKTI